MDIDLMQTAKPFIDSLLEKLIVPKFKALGDKCKLEYNKYLVPITEHFEEYLYRSYKKYSFINTLVLKNQQKLLKNIYLPLTLQVRDYGYSSIVKQRITGYPKEFIAGYNGKLLITDTAGMGKSTLVKRMFVDVIDQGYGIPICIELRRLSSDRTILKEIQEQINSITSDFNEDLLLELIQMGSFIFFLDGYDEITSDNRSVVTSNIQDFIAKACDNVFVLTSRPETALSSFGEFQNAIISPLTKKEAFELLRKYDAQGNVSKLLIDKLRSNEYSMIDDFLKNPLLVSLLFAAFDYKQTIPLKKHIFYRQVYDAYFDAHDLSKGDSYTHEKKSGLDIDDFDRVLRHIGFICMTQHKIEFEKDAILTIITQAKSYCTDLTFNPSDFLDDILCRVPLFCKDGNYYKWVHKSLQEYFAARFINIDYQNTDEVLSKIYNSSNVDNYINMLDIYMDIDALGFKKNILLPLCRNFIEYYNECSDVFIDGLAGEQINRISLLYLKETYIVKFVDIHPDDLLDEVNKILPMKKMRRSLITARHADKDTMCVSIFRYDNKYCIFQLIANRYKSLVYKLDICRAEDTMALYDNQLCKIEINSGLQNSRQFSLYNEILTLDNRCPYGFRYQAVKDELESINTMLKTKEESALLLNGL